jgi:hypothetical protein
MNTSNSSSRKWPAASADRALRAWHDQGIVFVRFVSGHELSRSTATHVWSRLKKQTLAVSRFHHLGCTGRRLTRICHLRASLTGDLGNTNALATANVACRVM